MGIQQQIQLDPFLEAAYEVPKHGAKINNGKVNPARPCNRRKKVDVAFVVEGNVIHADKLILTKRSSVFELMFAHGWGAADSTIPITDANSNDFLTFLEYLHKDLLHLTMNNALNLFKLAATYCVNDLQLICDEFLATKVQLSTVLTIAEGCLSFGGIALKKCVDLINEKIQSIIVLSEFLKISSNLMEFILEQNKMNISEEKLFEAFTKWKRCHNNHQNCDDIKRLIRFPVMDPLFLKNVVATSNVLTPQEYNDALEDAIMLKNAYSLHREFTFTKKNRISEYFYNLMLCKIEQKPNEDSYKLNSVTPRKVVNGTPKWKYTKVFNWKSSFNHNKRLPYPIPINQI